MTACDSIGSPPLASGSVIDGIQTKLTEQSRGNPDQDRRKVAGKRPEVQVEKADHAMSADR
jgi:hypothetical protein